MSVFALLPTSYNQVQNLTLVIIVRLVTWNYMESFHLAVSSQNAEYKLWIRSLNMQKA